MLLSWDLHAQAIPYWNAGAPAAPIIKPQAWPTTGQWIPYTSEGDIINDRSGGDPSNGGTSPQNYVNVSSGCPDGTQPSIYYYYANNIFYFRWRVQQIANTYATGPSPGAYGATDPWKSALWTVFFDLDGDGFRDLAAHLNGSSGSSAAPIDTVAGLWGPSTGNSLDYIGDTSIKLIRTNPTAFVQGNSGSTNNRSCSSTAQRSRLRCSGQTDPRRRSGTTARLDRSHQHLLCEESSST